MVLTTFLTGLPMVTMAKPLLELPMELAEYLPGLPMVLAIPLPGIQDFTEMTLGMPSNQNEI